MTYVFKYNHSKDWQLIIKLLLYENEGEFGYEKGKDYPYRKKWKIWKKS
jgi:hypothetical protein